MSTKQFDAISDLQPGRYDYKIKVRVIKKWRGATKQGEVFKPFNIILIDNMKSRIHAFIPTFCVDDLEDKIILGKVVTIKNFTVQMYKPTDIFRCLRMDKQLYFSKDTKIEDVDERGSNIQHEAFDLHDHSQLITLANQKTFLADVVGIIKKYDFVELTNQLGKKQLQARFTITDGSSNVKVVFWDAFGVKFDHSIKEQVETPVIVIISAYRVGTWNEEIELSNVTPTTFYLNYKHHSIIQLRRKMTQPAFAESALTLKDVKVSKLLTVDQLTKLGKDYIESDILVHVKMRYVEESTGWFFKACTTCYRQIERKTEGFVCSNCNSRLVPHPETRYKIHVVASDETGGIEVVLGDRQVRTLVGRRARDVLNEQTELHALPPCIKQLGKRDYTMKLRIKEINVVDHFQVYWAKDICNGFITETQETTETYNHLPQSSSQATSSTYHLEAMSDLNFQSS